MHLLGSISEESENVFGLNLIPGVTKRLPEQKNERIPNMGWLGTQKLKVNSGFKSLEANKDFYFVHSYEFVPDDVNNILSTSLFGRYEFVSGVLTDRICAFQFHPEKSAKIGKSLVMEIVGWARDEI
jgi:glutamine amidotransferase